MKNNETIISMFKSKSIAPKNKEKMKHISMEIHNIFSYASELCVPYIKHLSILLMTILFYVSVTPVSAERINIEAFGHKIEIYGETQDEKLIIDGRLTLKNSGLNIEATAIVGGVGVLLGTSNSGGNACDVSPFVISFPKATLPRVDGPLENCNQVTYTIKDDSIEFETPALAGQDGEVWAWTPTEGFRKAGVKHFVSDKKFGWNVLRERTIEHPSELLKFDDLSKQIYALLGSDKANVLNYINDVGAGEYKGDAFIGKTCVPHLCTIMEMLIFADIGTRKVFVAWKPDGKPIIVRPSVNKWPHSARIELRDWARKWK